MFRLKDDEIFSEPRLWWLLSFSERGSLEHLPVAKTLWGDLIIHQPAELSNINSYLAAVRYTVYRLSIC